MPGAQWAMNAAAPDDRRQGQPTADALADGHEVRDDVPVLGRPGPARPPEAALDLVEDEDRAVAVAQLAQPGEEAVGWDDDAAVALDRFDDDGGDRSDPGGRILQRVPDERERHLAGAVARAQRPAIRIRVGQEVGVRVAPGRSPHPRLAVEADDPAAATEVAAREGDDLVPPGQRPGQLERGVVGVRAAQPEQDPIEPGRRDRHERLLERDARLARRRGRDVAEPPDLVADGGHDRRMGMADGGRGEAAGQVDEAVAVRVGQRRAGRRLDDERRIVRAGPRPGALDRAHPLDDPGAPADPGRAA